MTKQVKTKKRVSDHGEVFTAEREVKAMCDLVADECQRIDSRFLEPAVGEGAFLKEVLQRKLTVVDSKYGKSAYDWERYSIVALSSIYGIDILSDNAQICRDNLYEIWNKNYSKKCKKEASNLTREAAKYILAHNIVCGNALTLKCVDENQNDLDKPITFCEWTFPFNDCRVKRRDFRLDVLLEENPDEENYEKQISLFAEDPMNKDSWMIDPISHEVISKPIREYPIADYRRITENE